MTVKRSERTARRVDLPYQEECNHSATKTERVNADAATALLAVEVQRADDRLRHHTIEAKRTAVRRSARSD